MTKRIVWLTVCNVFFTELLFYWIRFLYWLMEGHVPLYVPLFSLLAILLLWTVGHAFLLRSFHRKIAASFAIIAGSGLLLVVSIAFFPYIQPLDHLIMKLSIALLNQYQA